MTWQPVFDDFGAEVLHRHQLFAAGATGRGITGAVKAGHLIRLRRNHYAMPGTAINTVHAVRVGGRLDCVSALRTWGVFAFENHHAHIRMARSASRSRSPRNRAVPLTTENREGVKLHWLPLIDVSAVSETRVGIVDALAQATRCQQLWHAIASIDSALFHQHIDSNDLADIFGSLPRRLQRIRPLLDGRAESGQESLLRMIVREAGLHCELQVVVDGVGRVDMIVEGCLVVEADSRLAHDGWEAHVRDRNRDVALAMRGYMSLRPVYQHIVYSPADVREAILHLLAVNRRFRRIVG